MTADAAFNMACVYESMLGNCKSICEARA